MKESDTLLLSLATIIETGIGDLSIISVYNKYKESVPAIGWIRIWSLDIHLSGYKEQVSIRQRRKR